MEDSGEEESEEEEEELPRERAECAGSAGDPAPDAHVGSLDSPYPEKNPSPKSPIPVLLLYTFILASCNSVYGTVWWGFDNGKLLLSFG